MEEIEAEIRENVERIWAEYDKNGSGVLEKDELKSFYLKEFILPELNGDPAEFSEEFFDDIFKQFDKDGSGVIEKEEMFNFSMELYMSMVKFFSD